MRGRNALMTTAGTTNHGTGQRATAQRSAAVLPVPQRMVYAIYRETTFGDLRQAAHFVVQDQGEPMDAATFQRWLLNRFRGGKPGPLLSMLVIRETLGADDGIIECSIERRRGAIDGPYVGDPARVEFSGPALATRFYGVDAAGQLLDTPAAPTFSATPTPDATDLPLAGEEAALSAWFGPDCVIGARREPTPTEARVGLSSIYQARADGKDRGCAVGWFGPIPFVLVADFPRLAHTAETLATHDQAIAAVMRAHGLVRDEVRPDGDAWCLIVRSRDRQELFAIRPEAGGVRIDSYAAQWRNVGTDDQCRWIAFASVHGGQTPVDAYVDTDTSDLVVLMIGQDGQFTRHRIDLDGIELSCELANDSAIAMVHRVRHDMTDPRSAEPPAKRNMQRATPDDVPPDLDTLLAHTRAAVEAGTILRRAIAAAADWTAVRRDLTRLTEVLGTIKAKATIATLRRRMRPWDARQPNSADLTTGLQAVRRSLNEELATLRVIVVAQDRAETGAIELIGDAFPEARFHLEEAEQCLALGRPTAAMFHAMHLLWTGLRALRVAEPSRGAITWRGMMEIAGNRSDWPQPVGVALDQVRRRWRSADLTPTEKYTAEEAEAAVDAVYALLRIVAAASPAALGGPLGRGGDAD